MITLEQNRAHNDINRVGRHVLMIYPARNTSPNGIHLHRQCAQRLGNCRCSVTASGTTTRTLLDLQAGLPQVLTTTTSANVTRHVHALGGLHAHKDSAGNWEWMLGDGVASLTGEPFDSAAGLVYLRARHYRPGIGSFVSRDAFDGMIARPMSRLIIIPGRHQ